MKVQEITSRQNPTVREAAAIGKNRKGTGLFLAEGARLCKDAAESGVEILRLFFTAEAKEKYAGYIKDIAAVCREAVRISQPVAQLLSETKNSQGVFCLCREPAQREASLKGKILVLEQLQDPANLGTILRTAEALGISRVLLLGECPDVYGGKALRAGMGAAFRVQPVFYDTRDRLFAALHHSGIHTVAAVPKGGVFRKSFPEHTAIFIGNEGNGLTPDTIRACEETVTIPMQGRAESLNAATAAGILMWEMVRP